MYICTGCLKIGPYALAISHEKGFKCQTFLPLGAYLKEQRERLEACEKQIRNLHRSFQSIGYNMITTELTPKKPQYR